MAANRVQLEIHDIDRDAGKLVCQFDVANDGSVCALNEDGTDAALVNSNGNLRIVAVNKVVGDKADQSAIVSVNVSESLGKVRSLVYDDGGKLHALHDGGNVSLFDSLTKELILLEGPQKGQEIIHSAISLNAGYIAFLQKCNETDQPYTHTTIVKRKIDKTDGTDIFGYKVDKNKAAKPESKGHEQYGTTSSRGH